MNCRIDAGKKKKVLQASFMFFLTFFPLISNFFRTIAIREAQLEWYSTEALDESRSRHPWVKIYLLEATKENMPTITAAKRHDRGGYGHLQPGADHGVDPADAEDAVARGHQRAVS
jgi:hypothetical protein